MYTDDNGIVRFEESDNVSPLHTALNTGLQSVSDALATVYSAIVVSESPLSIRLVGESAPYGGTVIDTVGQLAVGDDIRALVQQGTATIVGKVGGPQKFPIVHAAILGNASGSVPHATVTQVTTFADSMSSGTVLTINGNSIVANLSGWYSFYASVRWNSNSSGTRQIRISRIAGGNSPREYGEIPSSTTGRITQNISEVAYVEAGTVISLDLYQNSGGSLSYTSFSTGGTSLRAHFLGLDSSEG